MGLIYQGVDDSILARSEGAVRLRNLKGSIWELMNVMSWNTGGEVKQVQFRL